MLYIVVVNVVTVVVLAVVVNKVVTSPEIPQCYKKNKIIIDLFLHNLYSKSRDSISCNFHIVYS